MADYRLLGSSLHLSSTQCKLYLYCYVTRTRRKQSCGMGKWCALPVSRKDERDPSTKTPRQE